MCVCACRVTEVGDRGSDDGLVRDVEVDVVVRAETRRAPVHLDHLGADVIHDEPIADFERLADLERDARDDICQRFLHGKTDDHGHDARTGEERIHLRAVAPFRNQHTRDGERGEAENLLEKLRGLGLVPTLKPLLPIKAP